MSWWREVREDSIPRRKCNMFKGLLHQGILGIFIDFNCLNSFAIRKMLTIITNVINY